MSRNSHGVILLFWVGERLIVTFGRQVQCRLLDHLMFCPFCMALAVPSYSLWLSCILQGWSDRASCPVHIHVAFFFDFKLVAPGCLLSCKQRRLHWASIQQPLHAFFCLCSRALSASGWEDFSAPDIWVYVMSPPPVFINRHLFSSRICMQPRLTQTPV